MDAVLPAAGLAQRLRGIPKFLLPTNASFVTLLERHITELSDLAEIVWIPVSKRFFPLLHTLNLNEQKVRPIEVDSISMTDSILQASLFSKADRLLVIMPDTFFAGELPYRRLAASTGDLSFACWRMRSDQRGKLGQVALNQDGSNRVMEVVDKDPECAHDLFWGGASVTKSALNFANSTMQSFGDLAQPLLSKGLVVEGFEVNGDYFDCGTPGEYWQLLRRLQDSECP